MRNILTAFPWWPGWTALWRRGQVSGLGMAVCFAAGLDLLLLVTFVWTDLLAAPVVRAAWIALAGAWLLALAASWRATARIRRENAAARGGDLFQRAQDEYLRGNWLSAEQLAGQLVAVNSRDAEARLLLATVLRRMGRPDEAAAQLDRLARQEAGLRWQWEIAAERARLAEARQQLIEPRASGQSATSDGDAVRAA